MDRSIEETLVAALHDPTWPVRRAAALALALALEHREAAVDVLVAGLSSPHAGSAASALRELIGRGLDEIVLRKTAALAVDPVPGARIVARLGLAHGAPELERLEPWSFGEPVRRVIEHALRRLPRERIEAELARVGLTGGSLQVMHATASALVGSPIAIALLSRAIVELERDDRMLAAHVLASIDPARGWGRVVAETDDAAERALVARDFERDADATLRRCLSSARGLVRYRALRAFVDSAPPDAVSVLLEFVDDEEPDFAANTRYALGPHAADPRVRAVLRETVEREGPQTGWALAQLGPHASQSDVPMLIAHLGASAPDVRAAAASALGRLGARDAIDPLARLASTSAHYDAADALVALAAIGVSEEVATECIAALTAHRSPFLFRALVLWGAAGIPRLVAMLAEGAFRGEQAARALVFLGEPGKAALDEAVRADDPATRGTARAESAKWWSTPREELVAETSGELANLVSSLRTGTPRERRAAATALAQVGPSARDALPDLIAAIDADRRLARIAVRAVAAIDPHGSLKTLRRAATARHPTVRLQAVRALAARTVAP